MWVSVGVTKAWNAGRRMKKEEKLTFPFYKASRSKRIETKECSKMESTVSHLLTNDHIASLSDLLPTKTSDFSCVLYHPRYASHM